MSFQKVFNKINQVSTDSVDKGTRFEKLIRRFFLTNRQYDCQLIEEIYLWKDFPCKKQFPARGHDTGIDLVVKSKDGSWWAIQCKYRSNNARIDKPSIDGFLTPACKFFKYQGTRQRFSLCYFVATSDDISSTAREEFDNQPFEGGIISYSDLVKAPVDWCKLWKGEHGQAARPEQAKPDDEYQTEIIEKTKKYFETHNRGQLIMACGSGKTLTSMWIAESLTNHKGFILFLVPSIALVKQTLEEWSQNTELPLSYLCICSDPSVDIDSTQDEDLTKVNEIPYPVSTDAEKAYQRLRRMQNSATGMTVIFSTYHSLKVVIAVQKRLQKLFDLIICDEAHRTSTTRDLRDKTQITDVHYDAKLQGLKRLYMTATPKIYDLSPKQERKAQHDSIEIASMDNEEIFGKIIHELGFGEAVDKGILCDYRVIIFEYDPAEITAQPVDIEDESYEFKDSTKIQACYLAINKVEIRQYLLDGKLIEDDEQPIQKIIAFCAPTKKHEKKKQADLIAAYWNQLTQNKFAKKIQTEHKLPLDDLRVKAVSGDMPAKDRQAVMEWLAGSNQYANTSLLDEGEDCIPDNQARIVTNVRCLSEGVDVPSLDAIIYLSPRTSERDIVQSIGRVMRKADNKKYGYIIIPVAVDSTQQIDTEMRKRNYATVWRVLNALKSHDKRFKTTVSQLTDKIKPAKVGERVWIGHHPPQLTLDQEKYIKWFTPTLIRKIGHKPYWEDWSSSIAYLVQTIQDEIQAIIKQDASKQAIFKQLFHDLQKITGATESRALEVIASHIAILPVFRALFDDVFVKQNPISQIFEQFLDDFDTDGALQIEANLSLKSLAQDIKDRVAGIADESERIQGMPYSENKQTIIDELYQNFFKKAFAKQASQYGIVYTPIQIIDFILYSAEEILKREFDTQLSSKNVSIIDPFAGTGSFISRLIENGLIDEGLEYKYKNNLWINETLLLPYYIANINIEKAYHCRMQELTQQTINYQPFSKAILVDTFQTYELDNDKHQSFAMEYLQTVTDSITEQNRTKFQVILGNPPYHKGTDSINAGTQNQTHAIMHAKIKQKYADKSQAVLVRDLYDPYIKAHFWGGGKNRVRRSDWIC